MVSNYLKHDHNSAKKDLKALNDLAVSHIMDEDIEFYRLMRDEKRLDRKTEELMREFIETFKSTKVALMNFLAKYTKDDALLDETFFETFNQIVDVLKKRIDFEEENLYSDLKNK